MKNCNRNFSPANWQSTEPDVNQYVSIANVISLNKLVAVIPFRTGSDWCTGIWATCRSGDRYLGTIRVRLEFGSG